MDQVNGTKRRGTTQLPKPMMAPAAVQESAINAMANGAAAAATEVIDAQQWTNRRASAQATRAANARQVSGRRRFVDPTTCEREYSLAEMEFMQAMHHYKQSSGRMFPTWSEVLEVIKALGYEKTLLLSHAGGSSPVSASH